MTLDTLRSGLDRFCSRTAREDLDHAGKAAWLSPSVELDREHADLFSAAVLGEIRSMEGLSAWGRQRWFRFIADGVGRLAAAGQRAKLANLLRRIRPSAREEAAPRLDEDLARLAGEAAAAARAATPPYRSAGGAGEEATGRGARELAARGEDLERMTREIAPSAAAAPGALDRAVFSTLWHRVVEALGFLRAGDGRVEIQNAPVTGAFALQVPRRIVLLLPSRAVLASSRQVLSAIGISLAWSHMPARLAEEDRLLPGDPGPLVYGELFARRLLEPAWRGDQRLSAAGLDRRTVRAAGAGRLLRLARAAIGGGPAGRDFSGVAWSWTVNPLLAAVSGLPSAPALLAAARLAAALDEYLKTRFGRAWNDVRRAGNLLRDLWSEGWRRPTAELLSSLGAAAPEWEMLIDELDTCR